jgi:hypothetical protein
MPIPQNITAQWSGFIAEWCRGIEPVEAPLEVERTFDALRRLWPEYLNELEAQGSRGLSIINPAIASGLTLAACEPLSGFGPVMARLRRGEESALAELEFAAALVRCGFTPVLEPQVGSKVLDCSVGIGSDQVYAEVIAPEQSAEFKDAQTTVTGIAQKLVESTNGTRTEILLPGEPEAELDDIITTAAATPPDGTVHNVAGIGWVRRDFLGQQPPNLGSVIANPDPRPAVFAATMRSDQSAQRLIFTSATVRMTITDERAHRLLSRELSHFSNTQRNILVVRVTNVPGGMKWWPPLALRWLQPLRNRRVGAVVLYEQANVVAERPTMQHRWRVVDNPYAYMPIPRSLINAIGALDESVALRKA